MTDRELLEQIHSDMTSRFAALDKKLDALFELTEKQYDRIDRKFDLLMEELISVKVLTKSRMDKMEARLEQLEQR
jgi:hypothetical protein